MSPVRQPLQMRLLELCPLGQVTDQFGQGPPACLGHLTPDLDFIRDNLRAGRELKGQDGFKAWLRFMVTWGSSLQIQIPGPQHKLPLTELVGWSPGIGFSPSLPGYPDGWPHKKNHSSATSPLGSVNSKAPSASSDLVKTLTNAVLFFIFLVSGVSHSWSTCPERHSSWGDTQCRHHCNRKMRRPAEARCRFSMALPHH